MRKIHFDNDISHYDKITHYDKKSYYDKFLKIHYEKNLEESYYA